MESNGKKYVKSNEKNNVKNNVKNITCIVCPQGCSLEIWYNMKDEVKEIKGYTCKRGLEYGRAESINPVRTLTTTIRIDGGKLPVIPVKSNKPLPKNLLFECMKIIKKVKLRAPINSGEVVIENILNTGVNIITTREVQQKVVHLCKCAK